MIHRHCQVCVKIGALGWLLTAAPAPSLRTMGESAIVTFQQLCTHLLQYIVTLQQLCNVTKTLQCFIGGPAIVTLQQVYKDVVIFLLALVAELLYMMVQTFVFVTFLG